MSLAPIALDRSKYSIGQIVHINSEFKNDDNSQLPETYIEINRTHFPSSVSACYQPFPPSDQDTFALIKLDKTRSNHTFIPNQAGLYVISTYNSSKHKEFKTIFEVINPVKSITFIMLIIAIGFFLALVLLSYTLAIKNKDLNEEKYSEIKKNESYSGKIEEIYRRKMYDYIEIAGSFRFIFISALVWSIIFALMFTEVEIGTHSPFGLVIRHNLNPAGGELDVNKNPLIDWGINIGGNWENNFSSGVVIPFYIFILGLVGGYLRYLHKAATKEKLFSSKPKEAENDKPIEKTSLDFQENTNGEISSIFLAPLLAAVVWFIFSEGRPDFNIYGMAAVSFSIGLVTTEIIQIIIKFMNKIVP